MNDQRDVLLIFDQKQTLVGFLKPVSLFDRIDHKTAVELVFAEWNSLRCGFSLGRGKLDGTLNLESPHELSEIVKLLVAGLPFGCRATRTGRIVNSVHELHRHSKDAFPAPSSSSE